MMKVAIATKTGQAIDEHFGHAKFFDVYALSDEGVQLLERRDVDHYCLGGTGDQSALQKILVTIADCEAVFVARVGDGPREKLAKKNIVAIDDYPWEEVQPVLQAYWAEQALTA